MKRLLFSISLISLTSPLVLCAPLSARADECPELQLDDRSGTVNVSAYGNDGVDPSTQWSDEPVKISKRAPFSGLDAYARHRMEIKGRGLWANLLGVLGDANARDFSVCGLDTRWQISKKPAPTMLDDASLGTILSDAMPSGQTKATFFDVTAMAPPGPQPDFLYNNLYSPEYGIINAAHILGRGWQAGQRRAPDRCKFFHHQCFLRGHTQLLASRVGCDLGALEGCLYYQYQASKWPEVGHTAGRHPR